MLYFCKYPLLAFEPERPGMLETNVIAVAVVDVLTVVDPEDVLFGES